MIRDFLLRDHAISDEILLRPLQESDLKFTLYVRNSPGIGEWFFDEQPITYASHRQWFNSYLKKNDECMFCIFYGGVRAGQIGLYNYNERRRSIEIGRLFITTSLQGHGIMKATLHHLLGQLCNIDILEEVHLTCKITNGRAINLYDSLGFMKLSERHKLKSGDLSIEMVHHCRPARSKV